MSLVALPEGFVVGGSFRIVRPLAEGGMGTLFVAEQIQTRKLRALKVMHPELSRDQRFRERFLQEAQVGARIESEHVVEVVDAGVDPATAMPWIAMELLEGEDLATYLHRGPIPLETAREILGQLCHALGAAHAAGVVHRDLKPENVFIARARRLGVPFTVKLLDLGIAKVVAEARAASPATAALGTPFWMAPEQGDSRNAITPAADVWALGLLAFRMLTGRHYWLEAYSASTNVGAILAEVMVRPIVPASERAQQMGAAHLLPPLFDDWFARCVAREPSMRLPTARDAWRAFGLISGGIGMTAPMPPQPPAGLGSTMQMTPDEARSLVTGSSGQHTVLGSGAIPPMQTMLAPQTGAAVAHTPVAPPPRPRKKSSPAPALLAVLLVPAIAIGGYFALRKKHAAPPIDPAPAAAPPAVAANGDNKFIRVDGAADVVLGLDDDKQSIAVAGLRHARNVHAPSTAFELQEHEVTWGELDPWIAADASRAFPAPAGVPSDVSKRAKLPATGVPWTTASGYCKSINAALPTEKQWELAARGDAKRRFPWGNDAIDLQGTNALQGDDGTLAPVMTKDQDVTPNGIHDLFGNAQEWTSELYTDDLPDQDESWVQEDGATWRVVRGMPLHTHYEPGTLVGAWYREAACATGACNKPSGVQHAVIRTVFEDRAFDGGVAGAAKPIFKGLLALPEVKSALEKCGAGAITVDYARDAGAKWCLDVAAGESTDYENCAGDGVDPNVYQWRSSAKSKTVVREVTASGAGAKCLQTALDGKLNPTTGAPKWPEAPDSWIASIAVVTMEVAPPANFSTIGFRCARNPK